MSAAHTLTHLFTPKDSNNYKARLLHASGIIGLIVFLVTVQAFLKFAPQKGVKVLGYAANIATSEVIELTNKKRVENGLLPLKENTVLTKAALAKGNDMLEDDYWAHVAPDGTEPWAFFLQVGYKYKYAGENLARDFSNPLSAVEAWMASPSHRDNLLSSKYSEIGIAVVEGDLNGVDTTIIVQLFGAKLDQLPTIPIASAQSDKEDSESSSTSFTIAQAPPVAPEADQPTKVSTLQVTRVSSMIVIALLVVAITIDAYALATRKIARPSGRRFAHLSFLGMVAVIIWLAREGQII